MPRTVALITRLGNYLLSHQKVRTAPICTRHAIAEVTYLEYRNDIFGMAQ